MTSPEPEPAPDAKTDPSGLPSAPARDVADLVSVVRELNERMPALTARGHGRRVQDYDI
jgi:hypothetical protein